ncbi:MAG: TIGR01777 family oxidoreductase [Ferruginibacter sp.]
MQTVLITGGTGLIGRKLVSLLAEKGYRTIILTRAVKNDPVNNEISFALWDVKNQTIDISAVQKANYIIHLAGAGVVDKKWTVAYKKEIIDSRTKSSELLINTLKNNTHSVKAVVSASATGWYGEDKIAGHFFSEEDKPANDFLGETCKLWEQSIEAAEALNIRVCKLRTGIVLSKEGGALAEFLKPVKLGIAGILGTGKQVVSWIHIDDLCRMYIAAIENTAMHGSYNAVAPMPVTNKELTLKLARAVKGKFYIPMHVPVFILKIIMGSRSTEVLKSTTVSNAKIKDTGFTFLYPSIDAALNNITTDLN